LARGVSDGHDGAKGDDAKVGKGRTGTKETLFGQSRSVGLFLTRSFFSTFLPFATFASCFSVRSAGIIPISDVQAMI
jgi:hypothetical protein